MTGTPTPGNNRRRWGIVGLATAPLSRRRVRFLSTLLTALIVVGGALAFYTNTGTHTATAATSDTLNPATISAPATSGASITITWTSQASFTNNTAKNSGISYTLQRSFNGGSYAPIASGPCSGSLAFGISSCTDTVTANGTYSYQAIAKFHSWTAASNATSTVANVAVAGTKLVFTTSAQTLTAGVTSGTITVQRQDASNNPATLGNLTVDLSTTSTGGVFRDTTDSTTITQVTIPDGSSSASFKYKDTVAGSPTIKAADHAAVLTPATQAETVNMASPTLSLTQSNAPNALSVTAGTAVTASQITATLAASSGANASGTITFKYFQQTNPPSPCTSGGTTIGTASVSGNGPYNPNVGFTPTVAGNYWLYASYGGDSNNNSANSVCDGSMTASEEIIVSAPSITCQSSGGPWNATSTWQGGVIPNATDNVNILYCAVTIPSGYSAAGNMVTVGDGTSSDKGSSLSFATSTSTLTVSNDVAVTAPNSGNTTNTVAVGAGSLTVGGNITLNGGNDGKKATLTTSTGTVTVAGNISLDAVSGSVPNALVDMSGGAGTLNLGGSFTTAGTFGTFTPGATSTVNFNGTSAQTTPSALTFANLTINNTGSTVTLGGNTTVNVHLSLTAGVVSTGANMVIVPAGGTVSRTSGMINGTEQRGFNTGSGQSATFDVGTGTTYTPISLASLAVTTAGTLTASSTASKEPHYSSAPPALSQTQYVNRYWTLTAGGGLVVSGYNATFTFVAGDLVGSPNTSLLEPAKDNSGWSVPGGFSSTSTTVTGTGFGTTFGNYAAGQDPPVDSGTTTDTTTTDTTTTDTTQTDTTSTDTTTTTGTTSTDTTATSTDTTTATGATQPSATSTAGLSTWRQVLFFAVLGGSVLGLVALLTMPIPKRRRARRRKKA
jgi:hypothetical protein